MGGSSTGRDNLLCAIAVVCCTTLASSDSDSCDAGRGPLRSNGYNLQYCGFTERTEVLSTADVGNIVYYCTVRLTLIMVFPMRFRIGNTNTASLLRNTVHGNSAVTVAGLMLKRCDDCHARLKIYGKDGGVTCIPLHHGDCNTWGGRSRRSGYCSRGAGDSRQVNVYKWW